LPAARYSQSLMGLRDSVKAGVDFVRVRRTVGRREIFYGGDLDFGARRGDGGEGGGCFGEGRLARLRHMRGRRRDEKLAMGASLGDWLREGEVRTRSGR